MSALQRIGLDHALALAILLFGAGLFTILARRSAASAMCGASLMIQAAGVELVAWSRLGHGAAAGAGEPSGFVVVALLAVAGGAHAIVLAGLVLLARRRRS